ncbi:hypothetical protein EV192_106299 [Actinocrispum wychmicini]|uniref:Alpha amylase inhibitor n=1 Tax=Actinocrispum wychmicini TaxID=1213861 RepID=A0A4R2JD34_9PSEU|nr:hypothetical protein EV192_106299 [Actinocrispum wychmicini]
MRKIAAFAAIVATSTVLPLAAQPAVAASETTTRVGTSAPACVKIRAWDDGAYSYQRATNTCGRQMTVRLVWTVATTHCETLENGESMTWQVLRPAWGHGAEMCSEN